MSINDATPQDWDRVRETGQPTFDEYMKRLNSSWVHDGTSPAAQTAYKEDVDLFGDCWLEVPKPTIDESLMQVYLDAAEKEINKVVKETEWWKNHIANLESLERRELADFNNSWDTAQEEKEMSKEELESQIFYEEEEDVVNSPSHYNTGNIECIEAIEDSMSPAAFRGYLKGNCMKYLWRYDYKGKPVEDLAKASWYLGRLIEKEQNRLL